MSEWKVIDNSNYAISDEGQLKNIKTGRILRLYSHPNGYLTTQIKINGKLRWVYIHKLVATYFCNKPDANTNRVNHLDENKHNNNASNLEWVTQKDNIRKYWDKHPEATTWNKGLTKNTDERVAKAAKTLSETHNKKKQMV